MPSGAMWITRLAVFGVALVFSLIVLGLSANYVSKVNGTGSNSWAGLAVAVSLLTLITLGPMLVIGFVMKSVRPHTSKIFVEVIVVGVLCILWLATGAAAADFTNGIIPDCGAIVTVSITGRISRDNTFQTLCRSYQAIEAFAFILWLMLMGYIITLVVFAFIARSRGNDRVWFNTVHETDFFHRSGPHSQSGYPMSQQSTPYQQPTPMHGSPNQGNMQMQNGYGSPSPMNQYGQQHA